ncbi:unnamed protein product [Diatraea saccharalis]|uniref:Uncharacterized protein n=1 Tax=Diatraea saccharalis TaxID=40085 RepID=A0A9N9R623_9NEOP|nr:unnamed protein product [Diatraea saccharalis]
MPPCYEEGGPCCPQTTDYGNTQACCPRTSQEGPPENTDPVLQPSRPHRHHRRADWLRRLPCGGGCGPPRLVHPTCDATQSSCISCILASGRRVSPYHRYKIPCIACRDPTSPAQPTGAGPWPSAAVPGLGLISACHCPGHWPGILMLERAPVQLLIPGSQTIIITNQSSSPTNTGSCVRSVRLSAVALRLLTLDPSVLLPKERPTRCTAPTTPPVACCAAPGAVVAAAVAAVAAAAIANAAQPQQLLLLPHTTVRPCPASTHHASYTRTGRRASPLYYCWTLGHHLPSPLPPPPQPARSTKPALESEP